MTAGLSGATGFEAVVFGCLAFLGGGYGRSDRRLDQALSLG